MRILFLVSTLCVSVFFLNACGLIRDRSSEYVSSTETNQIVIPESLSDRNIQSQYPIPAINNKRPLSKDYELPKPPNATAALDDAPYTIDQVNDQLWLRLYLAPGKVWPLLDAFWQAHQIDTVEENISEGYVVTDIIQDGSKLISALPADSQTLVNLNQVYFQAKLAQGIRRNTSEIKLRVIESQASVPDRAWKKKSDNVERDKVVLSLMGEFITSDALQNRYSMLANSIGGESRIQLLQNENAQNYLKMSLSYQRAWNELEKALEAAGIIVSDKNVSEKKFYISYLNESDISQWYLSDDSVAEKKLERNFSLELKVLEDGSIKVEVEQINESLDPSLKNDLLDLVFEHIS